MIYCFDDYKNKIDVDDLFNTFLDRIYPVGSFYITTINKNPNSILGIDNMHWERIGAGRTLIDSGDYINPGDSSDDYTFTAGSVGGYRRMGLNVYQIPKHHHNMAHTHDVVCPQEGGLNVTDRLIYTDANDSQGTGWNNFMLHAKNTDATINYGEFDRIYKKDKGAVYNPLTTTIPAWKDRMTGNGRENPYADGDPDHPEGGGANCQGSRFSIMSPYYACYIWRRTR